MEARAPAELLCFFAARAIPGVEDPANGMFRRSLRLPRGDSIVTITAEGDMSVYADPADEGEARLRVADALDVDRDDETIAEVLSADPVLLALIRSQGSVAVPGAFDREEIVFRAILGQQVSMAGARTSAGKMVAAWGRSLDAPIGTVTHTFPSSAEIAAADLSIIGMPNRRRATLRHLAELLASGDLSLDRGTDPAEVRDRLVGLPGIGPWTASYICMRALGDRDAFLPTDLGVMKGAAALGLPATPASLTKHAERWRPFRAYAVRYLWMAASSLASGSAAR